MAKNRQLAIDELPPTGAASTVTDWHPRFPTATAALLGIVLASAVARGGTVDKPPGPKLRFTAAAGEINHVSLSKVGTSIVVTDGNGPVTATQAALTFGCQITGNQVSCPLSGIPFFDVFAGDMNDEVRNTLPDASVILTVDGGTGDDFIEGGPADDYLFGGNGCDTFDGRDGYDTIQGDANGMGCFDTVTYKNVVPGPSGAGVTVFVGKANGTDMVKEDVEIVIGSAGNDHIEGDGNPNGFDSDDRDFIYGEGGDDVIFGGAGVDTLIGGAGSDQVYGEADDDQVTADLSFDAGDGTADHTIDCGDGTDVSWGEPGDGSMADCETANVRATIYIDDNGSDANNGMSPAQAVRTWDAAFDLVQAPGDTVIALDGTYTRAQNGAFTYSCGSTLCGSGGRPCGQQGLPITIRAQNERQAWLQGDGNYYLIYSNNCAFVEFRGFRVTNANDSSLQGDSPDNPHNVFVEHSEDVTISHLLCTTTNNFFNNHCIRTESSRRPVVEYNEIYDYGRHAISVQTTVGGRVSYNYCNSRLRQNTSSADNWTYGDECVSIYQSNGVVVENNVSERYAGGYQAHGGYTGFGNGSTGGYTGTEIGGSDNFFYGNISRADELGFYSDARPTGSQVTKNNKYTNNVVIALVPSGRRGFWLRSVSSALMENNTSVANPSNGFRADETSGYPCTSASSAGWPCSFTSTNNLAFGNGGYQHDLGSPSSFNSCSISEFAENSASPALTGKCGGDNTGCDNGMWPCATYTGMGTGSGQSLMFVPASATSAYQRGTSVSSVNTKVCHDGSETGTPCSADSDCTGGTAGTCDSDIGANILYRYFGGVQTANDSCTSGSPAAPWPCCTGNGTGHCGVWATHGLDCSGGGYGGGCASGSGAGTSDCRGVDTNANGTANFPKCTNHFIGCGAIVTGCSGATANGCNDANGDSCFDVHERDGIRLGQRSGDVTIPDYPQ